MVSQFHCYRFPSRESILQNSLFLLIKLRMKCRKLKSFITSATGENFNFQNLSPSKSVSICATVFLNLSYIICLPTAQLPTKISSFISSFSFGLFLNSFPYLLASPPYCIISINCLLCSINLKTYAGTCDRTLGSSYNKRLGNSCFYRTVTNLVPKYL